VMKTLFRAAGLRVTDWRVVRRHEWLADPLTVAARLEETLPYPLFIKPANMGSSVGVSKAHDRTSLNTAITLALEFDRKIVVEVAVPDARELEVAVIGNNTPRASVPGEIVLATEFYDYNAKYVNAGSRTEIPAAIDNAMTLDVQRQALAAFEAIDGSGLARVDFLLNRTTSELFVNEINTLPGFTAISMYAKLWAASGVPFPSLIDQLITLAIERHADKQKTRVSAF
jgi:D-alanine-D-alanine ligase